MVPSVAMLGSASQCPGPVYRPDVPSARRVCGALVRGDDQSGQLGDGWPEPAGSRGFTPVPAHVRTGR